MLNVTPIVDSTNVTLEYPRPEGRIETYVINWWPVDNYDDARTKNVTESNDLSDTIYDESSIRIERILVGDLMPGVEYAFTIYTVSYDLVSDTINLTTRTSEYLSFFYYVSTSREFHFFSRVQFLNVLLSIYLKFFDCLGFSERTTRMN